MFDNIEKNILDLVTFEDIKISYSVNKDLHVVFSIDPSVRASTRDWVGIYPVGWTAFESCLTYQGGFGRHYENSSRTRYMIFKARDLQKAKCGSHYQFVYVSKYLDVLGVSQFFYFQFGVSDVSVTPARNSSKQSVRFKSDGPVTPVRLSRASQLSHDEETEQLKNYHYGLNNTMSPNCKLAVENVNNKVFTSCGKCRSLFDLKETSFTLADKVDQLEKTVAGLMSSKIVPTGLPSTLIWNDERERIRFQKFLSDIYNPPKPDGSEGKTPVKNRLDAIRGLVSAMDEVIFKAEKVKTELLKMIESPCDGELCLIDPNASGILPVPVDDDVPKPDADPRADEPTKQQEIGELASGEPSMIQAQETSSVAIKSLDLPPSF